MDMPTPMPMWEEIHTHLLRIYHTGADEERHRYNPTDNTLYCNCCKKYRPMSEWTDVLPSIRGMRKLTKNTLPKTCNRTKARNTRENPKSNSYYQPMYAMKKKIEALEEDDPIGNELKINELKRQMKQMDKVRRAHRKVRKTYEIISEPSSPVSTGTAASASSSDITTEEDLLNMFTSS